MSPQSPEQDDQEDSTAVHSLEDLRRQKGQAWQDHHGYSPYGNNTGPLDAIGAICAAHDGEDAPTIEAQHGAHTYRAAGRVMLSRVQGKLRFMQLRDGSGEIQLFISRGEVGDRTWDLLELIDLGDVVQVEGPPMRTRTGQLSLKVRAFRPLTKALRAPAKHGGVEDVETRYRQRYVDLIEHHVEVGEVFRARTLIVRALREFLDGRGYLEVETPVLQPVRGGATARPFRTHHNALDMGLYLRIAPELYLKRLLVGGFDRVYEIGRTFRNEGISTRHNPEFTMLEFYRAYATYDELMDETEQLLLHVDGRVREAFPTFGEGRAFSLARPFTRVRMLDAVRAALGKRHPELAQAWSVLGGEGDWEAMRRAVVEAPGEAVTKDDRAYAAKVTSAGELLFALYEIFAEPHLAQDYRTPDGGLSVPVFVTDHPFDVSPLARKKDAAVQAAQYGAGFPIELTDRYELFVEGRELCNAFSELNDPDDQAARFRAQLENRARGDEEAMDYDADYIRALTHGMPPAAGFGLGVDRLAMLLTGAKSIRDVILFPLLRPEEASTPAAG
jgi:lysyl-tRNA synthetase class 2